MTALRRRRREDLQLRGLAPKPAAWYFPAIQHLAQHGRRAPDQLSDEERCQYGLFQRNQQRVAASTLRVHR